MPSSNFVSVSEKTETFLKDFKIRFPIVGLPGLGWQTPELAAGVSQSGGLGVFDASFSNCMEIEEAVTKIRSLTDAPFALLIHPPKKTALDERRLHLLDTALEPLRKELEVKPLRPLEVPDFDVCFNKILDLKIPALALRLGGLREPYMERLEAAGIPVLGLASNLRDAKVLVSSGVRAVVAAGWAEGGLLSYEEVPEVCAGTDAFALWAECARALKVPTIAAGSVVTAEQASAAKALGLAGVCLSDAFLASTESAIPDSWKSKLSYTSDASSEMIDVLMGRAARTLSNGLIEAFKRNELPTLQYPYQYAALRDIFKKARSLERIDLAMLDVGQMAYLAKNRPASEIVAEFASVWKGDCV